MKTIVRILMTAAAVILLANFANAQADATQHLCEDVAAFSDIYTATGLAASNTAVEWVATGGTIIGPNNGSTCEVEWPAGPGTYSLTLREYHLIGTCETIYEVEVIVHETPTATFAVATSTSCATQAGSFFLDVTSDTDWTLSYTIDGGAVQTLGGTGDTSYEFTPIVVDADTYLITGIVTDNGGCAGTIGAENDHVITPITLVPVITW